MTEGDPDAGSETAIASWDIVHVNKFYYPKIGGIESVVRAISEGVMKQGHHASVVAAVPRGRGKREQHNGVEVLKSGSFGVLKSVPIAPAFPKHLHDAVKTADIVHHHLPNPLGPVSEAILPTNETKRVVTYHSDIVRQKFALKAYKPILERFLASVDRILVTSPNLLEHSEFLSPHKNKCDVVPLSVPLAEYGSYNGQTYDLPVDEKKETILFVGRLNYYKGVRYLIDAMESIDANLLIVGDGQRQSAIEQRVTELGLNDSVSFLGRVDEELLHYCYSIADLFVLPSIASSEAFGIVQLEAMAYGVPVINTDLPTGVPWVSVDGETGRTVPTKDAGALAEAITSLLDNPERRRRYGENARKRVEEEFSRKKMLETVSGVYESLIE